MAKDIEKPYKLNPLSAYSIKQRILIHIADRAFYLLIKLIGRTLKFETEGMEAFEKIEKAGKVPIYAFWHDRIFAGTYFFRDRRIVVITSQSMDGEYIARFIKRLGYGSVRGSSTRGGVGALVEMIRLMRDGLPMAFTVDGPRGPRYEAKKGPVLLATKTGNPIVPFVVEVQKFWTVNSWDRLQIPKPFARAKVIVARPIEVPPDADNGTVDQKLYELQETLDHLTEAGRIWRKDLD